MQETVNSCIHYDGLSAIQESNSLYGEQVYIFKIYIYFLFDPGFNNNLASTVVANFPLQTSNGLSS